jgi:glycosyltransferase involved in cell wall biosynthesis
VIDSHARRHIVHVFPSTSWGGAEIYTLKLAKWQSERGEKVSVWTTAGSRMASEAQASGLCVVTTPLPFRQPLFALSRIAKTVRKNGFSHLHLHWAGGIWVFAGIKAFAPVKVFCHIHIWVSHAKKDLLHQMLFRTVNSIIVAGHKAASAARDLWSLSEKKIDVIPYAIDLDKFSLLEPASDPILKTSPRWIGMFARIDRQKGTLELLEALKSVLAQVADLSVMFVGEPNQGELEYAQEVETVLAAHPFRDRIHFFGFRKDYLSLMKVCELVVAPSYHESYSLAFLDAFALGKPVITTDIGGSPDLVEPPRYGWLTAPRDIGDLAGTVLKAVSSIEEISKRGNAAQEMVFKNHSAQAVLDDFEKVYDLR